MNAKLLELFETSLGRLVNFIYQRFRRNLACILTLVVVVLSCQCDDRRDLS